MKMKTLMRIGMPLSERHKQQKQKNYALMGVLLLLVVVLFALAMVKIGA